MEATKRTLADEARANLRRMLALAQQQGHGHVDVRAGDVDKALWPFADRTPIVSAAMYDLMTGDDLILRAPARAWART